MKHRIGFLFNHEAAHQVSHLAPMIPAIADLADDIEIEVFASTQQQLDLARAYAGFVRNCRFTLLEVPALYNALDKVFNKVAPFKRVAVLKNNLDLFHDLDALIVPERTSLMLRDVFGLEHLKMVRVCHGAGDRDVAWSSNISKFDLVLLPGDKHRDRMIALGLVQPENSAVIGYMKFDALAEENIVRRPFKNQRPIVLYNPHFDPHLSSWFDMGEDVLDYFANNQDFNLIFAPHIMLFKRRLHTSLTNRVVRWRKDVHERFHGHDNILIDTGSQASLDMTHIRSADLYLGDVSSQVYEFIARPRPCVFLNAHGADWQRDPKYKFWSLGPVATSIGELDQALKSSVRNPQAYKPAQQKLFKASIDLQNRPSAQRAAEAYCNFMGLSTCQAEPLKKYG